MIRCCLNLPHVAVGRGWRLFRDDVPGTVLNRHGLYVVKQLHEGSVIAIIEGSVPIRCQNIILPKALIQIDLGQVEVPKSDWERHSAITQLVLFNGSKGIERGVVAYRVLHEMSKVAPCVDVLLVLDVLFVVCVLN